MANQAIRKWYTANQEPIRKWYTALKSGEYSQAQGKLRTTQGYCCWGVACDLYRRDTNQGVWNEDNSFSTADGTQQSMPPIEVHGWLGISTEFEPIHKNRIQERFSEIAAYYQSKLNTKSTLSLDSMNDKGFSFSQIADVIWELFGEGDPPEVESQS